MSLPGLHRKGLLDLFFFFSERPTKTLNAYKNNKIAVLLLEANQICNIIIACLPMFCT